MIALLAAMREEIIGVQKRMVVEETLARHGWRLFRGEYGKKEILLVQTGIGGEKAEAAARQIPFLAVRAISDTLTQSLPQFDRFSNLRGAQLWREAIRHFLARPGELAQVPWVYRNALQARKSLTCFLDAFVPRL